MTSSPALMYHDVVESGAEDASGFPGRDAALYKVSPDTFDEHLRAIIVSVPSPTITFDDGGASAMRAANALEKYALRGYFFITANYIGTPGFVDADDLRELCRRGHIVGSHSCTHPLRMGHCTWQRLLDEWQRSRDIISTIVGRTISTASVPGGDFAPKVAEAAARAGFKFLFTSEPSAETYHAFGMTVRGRFTVQRWTTASTAAALARGEWLPCARQAFVWNAKKLSKRLGGEQYLRVRRLLLRHGNDVEWGDQIASGGRS